jgi:hypothetical protein
MTDWVGLRPRAIDFLFSRELFLKACRDTEKPALTAQSARTENFRSGLKAECIGYFTRLKRLVNGSPLWGVPCSVITSLSSESISRRAPPVWSAYWKNPDAMPE